MVYVHVHGYIPLIQSGFRIRKKFAGSVTEPETDTFDNDSDDDVTNIKVQNLTLSNQDIGLIIALAHENTFENITTENNKNGLSIMNSEENLIDGLSAGASSPWSTGPISVAITIRPMRLKSCSGTSFSTAGRLRR